MGPGHLRRGDFVCEGGTLKEKHPIIGFAGIVLILISLAVGCKNATAGMILAGIGMVILIYALLTGNVKFWG